MFAVHGSGSPGDQLVLLLQPCSGMHTIYTALIVVCVLDYLATDKSPAMTRNLNNQSITTVNRPRFIQTHMSHFLSRIHQ